jgi:long-chain acyl-CoA synthetase
VLHVVETNQPWLRLYRATVTDDVEPAPTLLALLQRAAEVERPLLHYFGTTLTTRDLDRMSDALATGFVDLGVRPGERIGLYLQNVPQFVIALFAAWKAGCSVVPINPMLRERELRYQLEDSGATLLVSLESLYHEVAADAIQGTSIRAVVTTSELDLIQDTPVPSLLASSKRDPSPDTHDLIELCARHDGQPAPEVEVGPDSVALLTYTSGTTGRPKAAMGSHRNLCRSADNKRRWFGLDESDVVLGMAPLFHITGLVAHALLAVAVPAPLILGYRFDPGTMLELIERYRATFSIGAITAYIALLDHPSRPDRDLSSLQKVFSGGAPVSPAIVERFETEIGVYIHNAYGLTETNAATHLTPLGTRAPTDPGTGALSIGVPIFATIARIVDEDGKELPPGEVGEIVIDGPQVAAGYWQRPEATTENFRADGFRTGDVGFMDDDGWFYLIDRIKDMIIASGYKVWPREVEDVLYEHPAVREAAVVGEPDEYRGETVKAYVSLRPGATVTPEELTAFAGERLAAYKRPRIVDIVDELPKTASGKILRRELRADAPDVVAPSRADNT